MNKQITTIFSDCFNTIIGRTKHPDDVLFDWAKSMATHYPQISDTQFFKLFKSCWKQIEKNDILTLENSEFLTDIIEIFGLVFENLKQYFLKDLEQKQFLITAQKEYFKAEAGSHFLKKKNFEFLKKQKNLGKKIFLVSDFYVSKKIMELWLKNLGLTDFFDDIFVSCELKKSKKSGSIYPYLLEKLNLDQNEVLMFGDNIVSDNLKAKKTGLKTKQAKVYIKLPSKEIRSLKAKLEIPEKYLEIFEDGKKENIYTNYAFPLYLFTKRLYSYCKKNEIKDIFFLAREGMFLKTLFEKFSEAKNEDIKTHYFIGSRSSLINAVLTPYDTRFNSLSTRAFISPHNFMRTLNFSTPQIKKVCKSLNLQENFFHLCFKKTKAYQTLLGSKEFQNIYAPYNYQQNEALWAYSKKVGIKPQTKDIFVVDSGWHGSMQEFLGWFFGKDVSISGCYVGMDTKNAQDKQRYGLLFSKKHKLGKNNKILSYRMLNYESVLRSKDNTCKRYDLKTKTPILDSGKTLETECFNKYVKDFQDKVLEKFEKIMKVDETTFSNLESVVARLFYRMTIEANNNSRNWYDAVQNTYVDSFGYLGYTYKGFGKFWRKLNYRIRDLNFKFRYMPHSHKKKIFWE